MHDNTGSDLFGIRLNETGIYYIRKAAALGVIIYLLVAVMSLLSLIVAIRNIYEVFDTLYAVGSWKGFSVKLIACSWFLTIVLNLFGVHYFVKFLRSLRETVDENNEPSFNLTFRYIYLNAIIFIWLMIINIFIQVLGVATFLFD
jgi:hypothetical protein